MLEGHLLHKELLERLNSNSHLFDHSEYYRLDKALFVSYHLRSPKELLENMREIEKEINDVISKKKKKIKLIDLIIIGL